MIYNSATELIGHTPLLRLNNLASALGLPFAPLAKLEYLNPAGSTKDRAALFMIDEAERNGQLQKGGTIIEPTSGNTGVGLSMICAIRGYRLILTMPETMSQERISLLRAHDAEVVLTSAEEGMTGSVAKAQQLHDEIAGSIILGQFSNPANPQAHYATTAQELWEDTGGEITAVVAGIGTGGTICGIGRRLKELGDIKIIGYEPATSPLITEGKSGSHKLQGIGANFIPGNYDQEVVDEVLTVKNEDAIAMARLMAQTEGILVGFTGGGAISAACQLIRDRYQQPMVRQDHQPTTQNPQPATQNPQPPANIIAILPDGGERYLSTDLYQAI